MPAKRSLILALVILVIIVGAGVYLHIWAGSVDGFASAEEKEAFTRNVITSSIQSCQKAMLVQQAASNGKITDAKATAYCDCSAQELVKLVTPRDEAYVAANGVLPPAVMTKVDDIAKRCGDQTLPPPEPPTAAPAPRP